MNTMSTASMMNVYGRRKASLTIHMLLSDGRVERASLPAKSQASGVARSTRGLCPTLVGGQPRITSPAAKPNNVIAQCADAEAWLRFSNHSDEGDSDEEAFGNDCVGIAACSGTAGVRRR